MGNFTVIRTVHSIEEMYLLPFALHLCTWSNKSIIIPLQPCYGLFLNGLSKRYLKILSGQTSLELLKLAEKMVILRTVETMKKIKVFTYVNSK